MCKLPDGRDWWWEKLDLALMAESEELKSLLMKVKEEGEKAEHWRTDAFELWCWRRLLRVPWTARRSNQSTLKEIKPEY